MTLPANRGKRAEDLLWCGIPVAPSERGKVEELIRSGELRGLAWQTERFAALLADGSYDTVLRDLPQGQPRSQAFAMMVDDAQWACDALADVATSAEGTGNIVSIPLIRENIEESLIDAAEGLSLATDRPNLAIAVSADSDGLNSVTNLIAAGYRVDIVGAVTGDQLRRADEAYVEGLARRLDQGSPLSSVSATVEMPIAIIDDVINARLDRFAADEDPMPPDESEIDMPWPGEGRALRGEVAVAYAKICYAEHQERVKSGAYARLIGLGAHPLRVRFSKLTNLDPPIVYAGSVGGPDVILTVTLDNLRAIVQTEPGQGRVDGVAEAKQTLDRLSGIHQDLDGALLEAMEAVASSEAAAWQQAVAEVGWRRQRDQQ